MIVEDLLKQTKPRAFIVSFNQAVERPKEREMLPTKFESENGRRGREKQ